MIEPDRDDADVIGRLLMRVYKIHERVIARGGGGLEGIRDAALRHAAVARSGATFGEVELYPTDFDKVAALFHSLMDKVNKENFRSNLLRKIFLAKLSLYRLVQIHSATRSAAMIMVACVLARVTCGKIEPSTTRRPVRPCTRPY
jgi:hypothetical protein